MVTELQSGMLVGRYRLQERIAQGGMGSVWAARDERLERLVAIKMLPRILVTDPSAERRFEREARAMGRLQHPNVVSIFDVGAADPGSGEELPFLVMELIRGRSLDQIVAEGPIAVQRAVRIMEQVGRALAAAHEAGIVHRDLKPSNVMVCEDDHVKVLDFGLARLMHQEGQTPEDTLTTPGMVLGSCPYMAPEQALGQDVSPRSDIFSCGAVLYEALSGRRAFDGTTPMKVLQAVVRCDFPPLEEIAPSVPASVAAVVERCLQKDPEKRYISGMAMAHELAAIIESGELSTPEAPVVRVPTEQDEGAATGRRIPWFTVAAVALVAVLAGLVAGVFSGRVGTEPLRPDPGRWTVTEVIEVHGIARHPDWDPRGSELVFDHRVGNRSEVVVIGAKGGQPRVLARTGEGEAFSFPRYSPDGKAVVVTADDGETSHLEVVPVIGGDTFAKIGNAVNGSWLDQERLVFSRHGAQGADLWTFALQDGREEILRAALPGAGWWAAAARPGGGFAAVGGPTESRSGLYVFLADSGEPTQWLAPGANLVGQSWSAGGRSLAASLGGELVRITERGKHALLPTTGKLWDPAFSPAGDRLAVVRQRMTNDLVLVDPQGEGWSCLVCGVAETGFGAVAGDGTVVYRRVVNGSARIVIREPAARERLLTAEDESASCPSFSPDGRRIAYLVARPGVGFELRVMSRAGGTPVTLAAGVEGSEYPSWSPDGRFVAYAAGEPVRIWAVPVVGGRPRPVSPEGGDCPVWSPDGEWIVYVVWTEEKDPQQGAWVVRAEGGQPTQVSDRPTRLVWNRSGDRLRQLRRAGDEIELWEAQVGSWQWTRRAVLDIGLAAPVHLEFLPLTTDPASDHLVINRRTSVSSLLVFSGLEPDRW